MNCVCSKFLDCAGHQRHRLRTRPCVQAHSARVHFEVKKQVAFGEEHRIVGNVQALGQWDFQHAPKMRWNEGDVWTLELDLPSDQAIEFKCVRIADNNAEWESALNRHLQVSDSGVWNVGFKWNDNKLHVAKPQASGQHRSNGSVSKDPRRHREAEIPSQNRESLPGSRDQSRLDGSFATDQSLREDIDERPGHLQWQGRKTTFMNSNAHSRDRTGLWDASGLVGPARLLVTGDEKAASWLAKISMLKDILVDQAGVVQDLDTLSNVYIYLQWINSGAIECKEGGGHYRPNKHAELAREIFKALEKTIDNQASDPCLKLLARKVHTKLPSFNAEFTQSTPLTRIRDIAHRNDIPHDLKREIKHTIQNKLHRNAGPEDLVATETMLKRILSAGTYNPDFVAEFKKFRDELRDFFNAATFATMLDGLRPAFDDSEIKVLDHFLKAKQEADKAGDREEDLGHLVTALHTLTSVRACILARLSSGLRNDASDSSLAMRQRFRLSEIRAEDVAFVLISRIVNCLSKKVSQDNLSGKSETAWNLPLGALVLSIRQLGLGEWMQRECLAIENELGTWQQAAKFTDKLQALRLKATLDRVHRLAQGYTDSLLDMFANRSLRLGKALGIPQEAVEVFSEAEIRASLMFQTSKLCTVLLQAARKNAGDAGWDVIVSGTASGYLVKVQQIDPGILGQLDQPTVLLVKTATGDEEVGGFRDHLKGVILAQALPHLSHLGIRARQEGITFVTCEDDKVLDTEIASAEGKSVQLQTASGAVQFTVSETAPQHHVSKKAEDKPSGSHKLSFQVQNRVGNIELSTATVVSSGAKAAFCAQLSRIAGKNGFHCPTGYCLPFGNMEHALKEAGRSSRASHLVSSLETAELQDGSLDSTCSELMHLIESCDISTAVQPGKITGGSSLLIARSSANVEDLAGMSAAGLYDSIGGIHADNPAELKSAITRVWASLYTRRAVLARRAAGVPQDMAQMAVLVQEQLEPDFSFVLHTKDPIEKDANNVYAEIAPGLGETLASGMRGSPWRLKIDRQTSEVQILAFANFSMALHGAGSSDRGTVSDSQSKGMYRKKVVDYTRQHLSTNFNALIDLGKDLKNLGLSLERAFQAPQDIEGAVIGGKLYVVQSRPQP